MSFFVTVIVVVMLHSVDVQCCDVVSVFVRVPVISLSAFYGDTLSLFITAAYLAYLTCI